MQPTITKSGLKDAITKRYGAVIKWKTHQPILQVHFIHFRFTFINHVPTKTTRRKIY
jgi:hypothetical protein